MDIFDFFDMAGEIMEFFKAAGEDIGNLFKPKKKRPFIHKPDDKPTQWGPDSYEPLSFLSEDDREAILRGDKCLEDFTMSHVWPPERNEDVQNNEEEQEQSEDSENAESSESDDSINPDEDFEAGADASESSGAFESDFDSDGASSSENYDGYIG